MIDAINDDHVIYLIKVIDKYKYKSKTINLRKHVEQKGKQLLLHFC